METGLINKLTLLNDDIKNLLLDDALSKQLIINFSNTKFTATALVSGKFVSLEEFNFTTEDKLDLALMFERTLYVSELLEYHYNKIIYISSQQFATYVPKEMYAAEIRNTYLNFTHKEFSNKDVISKTIGNKEIVFALPLKIIDAILQKSPTAEIAHYSEFFIANSTAKTLFFNKFSDRIDVVLFDDQKELILYNSYHIDNDIDVLYYINLIKSKNKNISDIQCLSNISDYLKSKLSINETRIEKHKIHDLANSHLFYYYNENPLLYKTALFYANN